ncbi:Arc family DNA-binding protein [Azotobacter chroococcum]|uniref:Arc family DNA-binding protein n=1 Tax=Azotobacter chroococcum TaxID=353 RepID=UPI000B60F137|nr:Arc family DNA-binding protein [Azotobacter chroococcum]ASL26230.1 hypothetical protein ACG10_07870 [Azotobacter chroococcum]
MSRTDLQVNFRMPAELKARLEQAAKENHRSVTAELVARLEESFQEKQPAAAALEIIKLTGQLAEKLRQLEQERAELDRIKSGD